MKHFWSYLAMAAACILAVLFVFYTGSSLFARDAQAAGQPPVIHYDVTVREPDAPQPVTTPDDVSGPESVPTARWLPEGGRILFVGNSLVQGLQSACDYENASFICKKGVSLPGLLDMLPEDAGSDSDIAVIEMGSNEMGLWSEVDFKASYSEMLGRISCPAVCLSVPPVCEAKSGYAPRVNNDNAALYSGWIRDVCADRGDAVYLDCAGFFGDTLDPGWTGDGLHLTGAVYKSWHGWIMDELSLERPAE